jgi:hypothetical protein
MVAAVSVGRAKVKIVRVPFAVALALLAAAPAYAAIPAPPKPPADGRVADDPDREAWRNRGMAVCLGEMLPTEGASAGEVRAACGCALDRLAADNPPYALPPIDPAGVRTQLGAPLIACTTARRPALAAAFARRLAQSSIADAAPPADADGAKPAAPTPSEAAGPAPAEPPKRAGPDRGSWLDSLSLPAWITGSGLPAWAWLVLALGAFLLLRGLLRRDDRRDLIGPPPGKRLGQRPPPPPPPRVQPPRRP